MSLCQNCMEKSQVESIENPEIFIEMYEHGFYKIQIITNKCVIIVYNHNGFTPETSDFYNKTIEKNQPIIVTVNKNTIITTIGNDVFKTTFTDIEIIPCAQIIGEVDYIEVKFRKVTIKTDVIVFEIRKGGPGGFCAYLDEDETIGKTIAYWVKNPDAINNGEPLYTFYDNSNEKIFEINYDADYYSESDSDSESESDFYDSKEYFDNDYDEKADTIVTYPVDKFSDEFNFGKVKHWKSEYGKLVIKTTCSTIIFSGSMDDDGKVSYRTPNTSEDFDNIIGEIIVSIVHVKHIEYHIITSENRYKVTVDNEFQAAYTHYDLEYEYSFFK